jgi:D-glycero-D-manno-heptose 1,7-bisphosphate phosphatase
VFLDRDGVINVPVICSGLPYSPRSREEFQLYPKAAASCDRLRALGLVLVVVTNQPDVARGKLDVEVLNDIHRELCRQVLVDGLYICPHDEADGCGCRKPAPGLLDAAAADLGLDPGRSFMVGDRWVDVEAGRRAGCLTVHIDRHYRERAADSPDFVASGLAEAVRWIEDVVLDEGVTRG